MKEYPPSVVEWFIDILNDWITHHLNIKYSEGCLKIYDEYRERIRIITHPYEHLNFSLQTPMYIASLPPIFDAPIDNNIPYFGEKIESDFIIGTSDDIFIIRIDIMGIVFACLSRIEEFKSDFYDSMGRFIPEKSHAWLNNYLNRPIVDEWMILLCNIILKVDQTAKIKKINYTFLLSCDVDRPLRYAYENPLIIIRRLFFDSLKNRSILPILIKIKDVYNSRQIIDTQDPYNTFRFMLDIQNKYGIKGKYYFMAQRTNKNYDAHYSILDQKILNLIQFIKNKGGQIGIHPSYDSYQDKSTIISDINTYKIVLKFINHKEDNITSRIHYLRLKLPFSLIVLAENGVRMDSSMGYTSRIGFRAATSRPYRAISPETLKKIDILIEPLIIMEHALFKIVGKNGDELADIKKIITHTKLVKGNMTLLWHNSELDNKFKRDLYTKIIRLAGENEQ